uniref:GH16 domain-containing protein n=1 Tax=Acrobeloides nanus TaxID=290746 RepID=A0A914DK48_9BILA
MILLVGRAFIFVYISFGVNPVFGQSGCQTSYTNMAIDGNDLTSVSGPSSSCCQHCQQQTGCAASTWTSANGGICWLKNDTQPLYASTGAFSVILAPSADQTYGLKLVYNSTNLFTDFEFTTHGCCGFVNSVDKNTATGSGLIGIQNDKAYIGLDNVTVLPWNNTHGRNSVTLKSLHTLNSGLVILNVDHVPTGPGIWPAFWTSSQSWPDSGEIDIVESIWSYDHNQMTLHASQGCAMPVNDSKYFTGSFGRNKNGTAATDCWVHDPSRIYKTALKD